METKLLEPTEKNIAIAAEIIRKGGIVAFPTETVYGLGADAMNERAVTSVYAAKGRPSDNPLIVHIADAEELERLTPSVTPLMRRLAAAFWPGPMTMVVRRNPQIPDATTGGLDTVAVRLPDNAATRALIRASGCPLVGPSANLSGKPSPTKARHVVDDLGGRIEAVLMGEDCRVGIESTVVDVSGEGLTILRPGIITAEQLAAASGLDVKIDAALLMDRPRATSSPDDLSEGYDEDFKPKSPGMKYRHYAPSAEMIVVEGEEEAVRAEIEKIKAENEARGRKVGVILFGQNDFAEAAHELFDRLREMDKLNVDLILAGALPKSNGVGFAVMNRMLKSAGHNVIKV